MYVCIYTSVTGYSRVTVLGIWVSGAVLFVLGSQSLGPHSDGARSHRLLTQAQTPKAKSSSLTATPSVASFAERSARPGRCGSKEGRKLAAPRTVLF